MSVQAHMFANGGRTDGLFRAAFMESGSASPTGFVDNPFLQATFDEVVEGAGCADATDAIECLRTVPASVLKAAMDRTPSFVSFQVSIQIDVAGYGDELMTRIGGVASQHAVDTESGRRVCRRAPAASALEWEGREHSFRERSVHPPLYCDALSGAKLTSAHRKRQGRRISLLLPDLEHNVSIRRCALTVPGH